jgi:hypothetical protein
MEFDFYKDLNNSEDPNTNYISYKIFVNEQNKISDFCNDKCINTYDSPELNQAEIRCIEECTVKLINLSSYNLSLMRNIKY